MLSTKVCLIIQNNLKRHAIIPLDCLDYLFLKVAIL